MNRSLVINTSDTAPGLLVRGSCGPEPPGCL